jgi:hypothetical protein
LQLSQFPSESEKTNQIRQRRHHAVVGQDLLDTFQNSFDLRRFIPRYSLFQSFSFHASPFQPPVGSGVHLLPGRKATITRVRTMHIAEVNLLTAKQIEFLNRGDPAGRNAEKQEEKNKASQRLISQLASGNL